MAPKGASLSLLLFAAWVRALAILFEVLFFLGSAVFNEFAHFIKSPLRRCGLDFVVA
jgi:hypothetical protein